MFAKTIVFSDSFLDMPLSARCLYFTLGMVADDDGFVNNPKSIMRQCGAQEDDMKILLAKNFLLSFESGVIVIKHWRINNYLQKDRYNATKYLEEKAELSVTENGSYHKENGMYTQDVYTQESIGKDRLVKDSKESADKPRRSTFKPPSVAEVSAYCRERGNSINAQTFVDFYESKGWRVGNSPMKSWQAAVRTWERREKIDQKKLPAPNRDNSWMREYG